MYNNYKIIALCITQLNNEHSLEFVRILNDLLMDYGYRILIFHTCTDLCWDSDTAIGEDSIYKIIPYDIVDAVVFLDEAFYTKDIVHSVIKDANAHNIPVICAGAEYEGCYNIVYPYAYGFEQVLRHILDVHKPQDVVYVAGFKGNSYSEERKEVYLRLLREYNLPIKDENIYYGDFWYHPTEVAAQAIIDRGTLPDAIICVNDFTAITISNYFQKHGINIPDDVIIAGIDGTRQAEFCNPSITTNYCKPESIVKQVLDILENVTEGKDYAKTSRVGFTMKLGASCGCGKNRNLPNAGTMLKETEERLSGYREISRKLYETSERLITSRTDTEFLKGLNHLHMENTSIMINQDWTNPDINPMDFHKEFPFDNKLYLVYKDLCSLAAFDTMISIRNLCPDFDTLIEGTNPIMFNALCYIGNALGYFAMCAELDPQNFIHIAMYTNTLSSAFGDYLNVRYLQKIAREMEDLANHDSMTGLFNRKGFLEELPKLIKSRPTNTKTMFASIDLDGLKHINDTFGHNEGDVAIKTVANAIKTITANNIIGGRIGGDEFVIFAIGNNVSGDMLASIDKFLDAFNASSNLEYKVSASIGYVVCNVEDFDFESVYREADNKMYEVKQSKPYHR